MPRSKLKPVWIPMGQTAPVLKPIKKPMPQAAREGYSNAGGVKKPHRFRPGTVALREIRKYQKTSNTLIPFRPFCRLVKELSGNQSRTNMYWATEPRWQPSAVRALQEAAESYVISVFEDCQVLALHSGRVGITAKDMHLVRRMRTLM